VDSRRWRETVCINISMHISPWHCFPLLVEFAGSFWCVCSLTITEDPKLPNAATILMRKQDHTMGNMIRALVQPLTPDSPLC
jgi:hypothetical protein